MPTDRWRLGVCKKKLRIAKMVRVGSWKEPTWGARKLVCWDLRSAFWLSSGQKKLVMIKKKLEEKITKGVCWFCLCGKEVETSSICLGWHFGISESCLKREHRAGLAIAVSFLCGWISKTGSWISCRLHLYVCKTCLAPLNPEVLP